VLSLSPATRIFVALAPVDMRRSFNGLYAHVQVVLSQDPLSGHLFLFTNKLKNVCGKRGTPSGGRRTFPTARDLHASARAQSLSRAECKAEVGERRQQIIPSR
jgi:hypothetical protein